MPSEALWLLFALIALPLIQRIVHALGLEEEPKVVEPVRPPPIANLPKPASEVEPAATNIERLPKEVPAKAAGRVLRAPVRVQRLSPSAGLRGSANLRRAIVLTSILGPCRANTPHAWPHAVQVDNR